MTKALAIFVVVWAPPEPDPVSSVSWGIVKAMYDE